MERERKIINVVGAAIVTNGTLLCAQRGPGKSLAGYWEFPGGKIEPHETARQALHREIEEELLCEVEVAEEYVPANTPTTLEPCGSPHSSVTSSPVRRISPSTPISDG